MSLVLAVPLFEWAMCHFPSSVHDGIFVQWLSVIHSCSMQQSSMCCFDSGMSSCEWLFSDHSFQITKWKLLCFSRKRSFIPKQHKNSVLLFYKAYSMLGWNVCCISWTLSFNLRLLSFKSDSLCFRRMWKLPTPVFDGAVHWVDFWMMDRRDNQRSDHQ